MRTSSILTSALVTALLQVPTSSEASCNLIPGVAQSYAGVRGSIDRPFASPEDWIELGVNATCDAQELFSSPDPDDYLVTVFFPHGEGLTSVVTISSDCSAIQDSLETCSGDPAIHESTCIQSSPQGSLPFPNLHVDVIDREDSRHLRFRFPDTDQLTGGPNDRLGFAGPARIVVTASGEPFPCEFAQESCASNSGSLACIDELFLPDGTCEPASHPVFPSFTALPHANLYQGLCVSPSPPCTAQTDDIRLGTDSEGNLLIPMDWRGVLVEEGLPVARLLRGSIVLQAASEDDAFLEIPNHGFLQSFTNRGGLLPPIFEPQVDETDAGALTLFGSVDAPYTVLRIARRSWLYTECYEGERNGSPCLEAGDCPGGQCLPARCRGGDSPDQVCSSDAECPEGECGPSMFEFRDRRFDDVGPVRVPRFFVEPGPIAASGRCQSGGTLGASCTKDSECTNRCVTFSFGTEEPVPVDGMLQSDDVRSFVVNEGVDGVDLNGDLDFKDEVITLADRRSGRSAELGDPPAPARSVVRTREDLFSTPAVALENRIVAFLEPESTQGACDTALECDQNEDGDAADALLRLFRIGSGGAEDLLSGQTLVADATRSIDGKSIHLTDGRLFYHRSEADSAPYLLDCLSCTPSGCDGSQPTISADGRYAVYIDGDSIAWRHDRRVGAREVVSVDIDGDSVQAFQAVVDASGRYVAFTSRVDDIARVFLRDMEDDTSKQIDVTPSGAPGNAFAAGASVSRGGRYVAFHSGASDLVPGDTNELNDVFVRDMEESKTIRVSVTSTGLQASSSLSSSFGSVFPYVSEDGRLVTFVSSATNFVPRSPVCQPTLVAYIHDRDHDADGVFDEMDAIRTELVETDADSSCDSIAWSLEPSISSGDAHVAFVTTRNGLVPNDVDDSADVFLRRLGSSRVRRISVSPDGRDLTSEFGASLYESGGAVMSEDGRYVGFSDYCSLDFPAGCDGLGSSQRHIYRLDTLTGAFQRMDLGADGIEMGGESFSATLTRNGRVALFTNYTFWVPGDAAGQCPSMQGTSFTFLAAPDPTFAAADVSGDGDSNDTVLEMIDVNGPSAVATLFGPAGPVTIFETGVAYLVPESEIAEVANYHGTDLNADGDDEDLVVHLHRFGETGTDNLGMAATEIHSSEEWIAVLVPERGNGVADANGDGDSHDQVPGFYGPVHQTPSWRTAARAADSVAVAGSVGVFSTPEAGQGTADLNGDGDSSDRIAQIFHLESGATENLQLAIVDFVAGDRVIAFRVSEAGQSEDLNCDGDMFDDVLFVYDTAAGRLVNTEQTIRPCLLEACDPTQPYRVSGGTVRFLTFEADQNEDLSGDGDSQAPDDLVLQIFNIDRLEGSVASYRRGDGSTGHSRTRLRGTSVDAGVLTTFSAIAAGICSDSGLACVSDPDCNSGSCIVPPGVCVREEGLECVPAQGREEVTGCLPGTYCVPTPGQPSTGTCHKALGNCSFQSDCGSESVCQGRNGSILRIMQPFASSSFAYVGIGECIEASEQPCASSAACGGGQHCAASGVCERTHGTCVSDSDCPPTSVCRAVPIMVTLSDIDGDALPDTYDNCPSVKNADQQDQDGDGVGDACDACTDENQDGVCTPDATDPATNTDQTDPGADAHPDVCTLCGDADQNGMVVTSDALRVLQRAVGWPVFCPARRCDVDANGTISTTDALRVLRRAVGHPLSLNCPA